MKKKFIQRLEDNLDQYMSILDIHRRPYLDSQEKDEQIKNIQNIVQQFKEYRQSGKKWMGTKTRDEIACFEAEGKEKLSELRYRLKKYPIDELRLFYERVYLKLVESEDLLNEVTFPEDYQKNAMDGFIQLLVEQYGFNLNELYFLYYFNDLLSTYLSQILITLENYFRSPETNKSEYKEGLKDGSELLPLEKSKKIPAKYFALYHQIRIVMGEEKDFEKNPDDTYKKSEIMAFAKKRYPQTNSQGFYKAYQTIDVSDKISIARDFKGYKEQIKEISQNDAKVIAFMRKWPV